MFIWGNVRIENMNGCTTPKEHRRFHEGLEAQFPLKKHFSGSVHFGKGINLKTFFVRDCVIIMILNHKCK